MGRPLSKPRPKQGQLLAELRIAAGLSQYEAARIIDVPQQNIAYWEVGDKPPRSDVLPRMAEAYGVRIEQLIYSDEVGLQIERLNKPAGKVKAVFEQVAKLPRTQQDKVVEFVSAFVQQYHDRQSQKSNPPARQEAQ